MLRFITQRIFFIVIVSTLIVLVVNIGMRMSVNSDLMEPSYDILNATKPAWEDTKTFFSGIIQGDFGSYFDTWGTIEIRDTIREKYINSAGLLAVTILSASVVGFLVGGIIALSRHRSLALPLLMLTILGVSIPSFFGGFLMQRMVAYYSAEIPLLRKLTLVGTEWDFRHMLLPVLVLSARPVAYLARSAFISLDRVMREDFIVTAYAKGLPERLVLINHAIRNIAVPLLTAVGVSLRFSLSSLPVVELLFNWEGIGLGLIKAINDRNAALVVAMAFVLGLTIQIVNFMLDIIFRMIDPRIRETL